MVGKAQDVHALARLLDNYMVLRSWLMDVFALPVHMIPAVTVLRAKMVQNGMNLQNNVKTLVQMVKSGTVRLV